jgi:hypothetical protein
MSVAANGNAIDDAFEIERVRTRVQRERERALLLTFSGLRRRTLYCFYVANTYGFQLLIVILRHTIDLRRRVRRLVSGRRNAAAVAARDAHAGLSATRAARARPRRRRRGGRRRQVARHGAGDTQRRDVGQSQADARCSAASRRGRRCSSSNSGIVVGWRRRLADRWRRPQDAQQPADRRSVDVVARRHRRRQ